MRIPNSQASPPAACDGHFHVVASADGTGNNYLAGIAVVSANDVWAVGNQTTTGGVDQTLAEHWNGSTWTTVGTPNIGARRNDLTGVSAISSNDVWAVGSYQVNPVNSAATLAEHWNGTSWTRVPTPNPSGISLLSAVTAISSNNVWAVGGYYDSSTNTGNTLIEQYNGTTWVVRPSPSGATGSLLDAISALNSADIWAVGYQAAGPRTASQSLAEHYDGAHWSVVPTPNLGGPEVGDNEILGVDALEPGHAVAVGYGVTSYTTHGAVWDLVNPPGTGTTVTAETGSGDNRLNSLVRSSGSLWAVGTENRDTNADTMVRAGTWDPTSHILAWAGSADTGDNPSLNANDFLSVAGVSPSIFWAAGFDTSGPLDQTLTEFYCNLKFGVTGPASAVPGVPLSVTVRAKEGDNSTNTAYRGTVHFTSSDPGATLPADYTFTPGDAGVHTFNGVVLMETINQPTTITVSDTVTPFVNVTTSMTVACPGACQSPGGTPGDRGAGTDGGGGTPGGRGSSPAPPTPPGARVPISSKGAEPGSAPRSAAMTGTRQPASRMPTPSTARVAAPAPTGRVVGSAPPAGRVRGAAPGYAITLAAAVVPTSPGRDPTPWYLLLVLPLLPVGLGLFARTRKRSD